MRDKIKRLTKNQRRVYDKIKSYIEMAGISPTLEELRQMLSLNSINSVSQYLDALERHKGNRSAAAESLGISRRTLYNRLDQYRREGFLEVDR